MVEVAPGSSDNSAGSLVCRFAETAAERRAVYELRYRVYVEEMAKQMAGVDHAKKTVSDDVDQHADILFVTSEVHVVGTARLLWGGRYVPPEYTDFYSLDGPFAHLPPRSFTFSSRLMIEREWRHGRALRLLVWDTYRRSRANGAWLDFLHCTPALVSLYEGLGYRRISKRMIDTHGVGQQCAMALVTDDLAHLTRVRSPLLAEAKDYPSDPGHGDWFATTFPEYAASYSCRVMGEEDFLTNLSTHLVVDQVEIFHGMTRTDISNFMQSGVILDVEKGDAIVRAGEVGRELFVILDGAAEVRVQSGMSYVVSMTLGKGDLFGEVAFIHRGRRSADVIALSDVKVLSLSPGSLETLVREKPAFGARVLLNIARILAVRLANASELYASAARVP